MAQETDVERLKRDLEETKRAQSGSDRTNTELKETIKKLQAQLDGSGSQLSEKEIRLNKKETALAYAISKNIDPVKAMAILGYDEEMSDENRLDLFSNSLVDALMSERDAFARSHGRSVERGLQKLDMSYAQLLEKSDEEIQRMGSAADRIVQNELEKKKPSLRNKLWSM